MNFTFIGLMERVWHTADKIAFRDEGQNVSEFFKISIVTNALST